MRMIPRRVHHAKGITKAVLRSLYQTRRLPPPDGGPGAVDVTDELLETEEVHTKVL
jgi:hypothetical protein